MKNLMKLHFVLYLVVFSCASFCQTYTGSWISVGPFGSTGGGTDFQGRIISFAENPSNSNIIYLGGESGGLWKRDETANTAELMNTDGLERIGIAEIAINPSSGTTSEEMLIGTGQAYAIHYLDGNSQNERRFTSSGIYRTTNGGATWTQVLSWQSIMNPTSPGSVHEKENTVQIAKIIYNRDDPSKVLAAVRNPQGLNPNDWGHLYRSTDYGATWTDITAGITDRFFFDMDVSPGDANTVYLSSHRLYKSTNFGMSWTDVTNNLNGLNIDASSDKSFILLETAPLGSSSTYDDWLAVATLNESTGGAKELFISTDGMSTSIDNKTFDMYYTMPINRYNHSFEVSHDFNRIYFGGGGISDRIRWTGSLIEPIHLNNYLNIHADIKELFIPNYNGTNEYLIYAGTDGGAYINNSSTLLFSTINKDISVLQFHSIASSEVDDHLIGGTQDNSSMVFRNNAWFWTPVGGDGSDCEIDPSNSDYMFYDDYLNPRFYASADVGVTAQAVSIVDDGDNILVPIEISNFDNSRVYVGDDVLKYYEHDYEYPSYSLPTSLTPLTGVTTLGSSDNYVLAIGLSNQDPDKIYIAVQGYYTEIIGGTPCYDDRDGVLTGCEASFTWNDPTAYMSYNLFKTTDGGSSWTDVSPTSDLPGVIGNITGIAVNPNDDDEVWITYDGFERIVTGTTLKNQNVFKTTNGGADWTEDFDAASALPICYTNKVVYQNNSNNRIFIATDKGVYWKEDGINWQPFSSGLPNCPITDLSIDDCEGNIYASSYGRGIWESDLPINTYDDIHISTSTTWNSNMNIASNVVVEANAVLTITGGATIEMAGGKKITVMRGGRLNIDNATLTNGCEALWEGIEVWGYNDLDHPPITDVLSGAYPSSIDDDGVVFINGNSIIENAHNAISTSKYNEVGWSDPDYHGGIIVVLGSTFRNNRRSAEFLTFDKENVSEFIGCTFITDALLHENVWPYAHVSMWDVTGVLFVGNIFENTLTSGSGYKRGKGIYSEEATYDVLASCITPMEPCGCEDWSGNNFTGLYRGIEARSVGASFVYPLTIDRNLFQDNERAILVSSIGNIELINNDFQVPDYIGKTCYGLYLEGCLDYHVENNTFSTYGSITNDSDPNSGLFVANNSTSETNIYRNNFTNIEIGVRCQNINSGLQIGCNEFTPDLDKYNIVVSSGSIPDQGSCTYGTAGNTFSHDCAIPYADFRLLSGVPGINYFYGTGEDPFCYSSAITLNYCNSSTLCESGISDPCSEGESAAYFMQTGNNLQKTIDIESSWIDGGNTLDLLTEIEQGSITLDELEQISPYLSDQVLQSLIEMPNNLTTLDLLTVLGENSPLSQSVSETLSYQGITSDAIVNELAGVTDITDNLNGINISPMQELLIDLKYLHDERAGMIKNAVYLYLMENKPDSAIFILSLESEDWAKQMLADIYFDFGDYDSALSVLTRFNSIDSNFILYKDLMSTLISIKNDSRNYSDMNGEEEALLRAINTKQYAAGIAAGNVLRFAFQEDYPEVIDSLDDIVEFKTLDESSNQLPSINTIKMYPNPVDKLVYIDFSDLNKSCDILLTVIDLTGHTIVVNDLDASRSISWMDISKFRPGIYFFKFTCNGDNLGVEKLIIE
ncbi:MAG: T9SS type A sorting domain-containing protein [Chitinophagales bacterium]